jgi:pyruvate formate-lyase activating enzyme-like uncharacterized protein
MIHLDEIGIDHLNLHQIRCTSHNYKKLIKRGYFFFPGPQVTVPESELAALFLVKYAIENAFSYHVNYCSAIYKYRYQRMAARRRHAPYILQPWEEITETGMIRILSGEGETKTTRLLYEQLKEDRISEEDYDYVEKQNKIHFKSYLWNYFKNKKMEIRLGYARPFILPSLSYRNVFKEIELNARRSLVIERTPVLKERKLNDIEQELYEKLFIDADSTVNNYKTLKGVFNDMKNDEKYDAEIAFIVEVYDYERLGWGLLEYI